MGLWIKTKQFGRRFWENSKNWKLAETGAKHRLFADFDFTGIPGGDWLNGLAFAKEEFQGDRMLPAMLQCQAA